MPYITKLPRATLDPSIYRLFHSLDYEKPGELNYTISALLDMIICSRGLSYGTVNELVGVLECVKMELYRRVAAPYEDKACERNGEVYSCLK